MTALVRGCPDGLRYRRMRALQPQGLENMMGRSLLTNSTRHQSESDSNGLTGPTISESRCGAVVEVEVCIPCCPLFRLRVSHDFDHAPFPHPAHQTGRADFPHPAFTSEIDFA